MVCKNSQMEIFLKDNIVKVNLWAKENIFGEMDLLIKVILLKDLDMVKDAGNPRGVEVIYILECMKMIRNAVMVDMFGLTDVYMMDTLKTISSNINIYLRNGRGRLIYQDGK